jgi:hypothetical protein
LQAGREKPSKKEPIATVMPSEYDIAVETFVNPLDLPLLQQETKRIYFDGWPTICFQLARYVLWNF